MWVIPTDEEAVIAGETRKLIETETETETESWLKLTNKQINEQTNKQTNKQTWGGSDSWWNQKTFLKLIETNKQTMFAIIHTLYNVYKYKEEHL